MSTNNSFSIVQDSNSSEMEYGTVALLINPFMPKTMYGRLLRTAEYWLGTSISMDQTTYFSSLYRYDYLVQYESMSYNEWRLIVMSV